MNKLKCQSQQHALTLAVHPEIDHENAVCWLKISEACKDNNRIRVE